MDWQSAGARMAMVGGLLAGCIYPAYVFALAWAEPNLLTQLPVWQGVWVGLSPLCLGPLLGLVAYMAWHLWSPWGGEAVV